MIRLELFRATSGFTSARLCFPNLTRLLHSAECPERESEDLPLPDIWAKVLVCLGTGLGYHLQSLRQHTTPLLVILCEAWPELLAQAMHQLEGTHHTVISCNPLDPECLQTALAAIPLGSTVQWMRHPASYRIQKSLFEPLERQILAKITPPPALTQKPRTILLYGQHFLQEEIFHALQELENPVQKLEYGGIDAFGAWESQVQKAIQEFRPDQILSVNMKGLDPEGVLLSVASALGVSVHVWFVDDPRPIALAQPASLFGQIYAWCWERAYLPWLRQKGFNNPRWLPLAGDPHIFTAPKIPLQSFGYDLVFTGSSMGEEYLSAIRRAFLWDPHLAPLVAMRAEEYLNGTRAQDALLEELALPFQDERNKTWLTCLIQHTASYKKRTQYLAPLVHHGLVCAGDASGWRHALGPLVKTLGDLNYRRDLAQHYRNCKVNLNLTSCQMPQTVNQRIFDVPLAGSFLLTDWQSDLSELFDPSELATFQSPEELCEKSLWFQEHAVEREQISALARKRILGEHTYMHRLRQIQPN